MARPRLFTFYTVAVAVTGLGLALFLTLMEAPHDVKSWDSVVPQRAGILLILTFLASLSPIESKTGAKVTVGMAPLFAALLALPPWALMWVAAIGSIDQRLPGRDVAWRSFFFTRGMMVFTYGIPSLAMVALGLGPAPLRPSPAWFVAQPLLVLAIAAINLTMLGVFFALYNGSKVSHIAKNTFGGSWLTYIALPAIGYLIYVFLLQSGPVQLVVFLLYGPLIVYRTSLQKQSRLDQWLRDSFIMQSRVVDKRDGQTFGHSQRVGELSETVARMMNLSEDECNTIRVGGILHDLGKIAIPDSILLKPGRLTPEEYEIIKTHPVEGAQILAEHPEQKGVSEIVHHHHERWDGKGYPDGLKGEAIPLGSRIVNACDAFDTITQARVFRPTVKTPAEAIRELRELAGSWYDPEVITCLETIIGQRWGVEIPIRPPARRGPTYADLLRVKPFRRLWLGQAVSYYGDMMNTTGLAIMLFVLTHSAAAVAIGLIARTLPLILLGLVAGPMVDRFNRQVVMIGADLVRAVIMVSIPFIAMHWLPGVFIAVAVAATASTFFNPAKQAMVPNLLKGDQLIKGNSLMAASERTMDLLGYAMAGIIAAALSWAPLFVIDAGTYVFSAFMLLGVPDIARGLRPKALRLVDDVVAGVHFIARNPTLRSTMTLTTITALCIGLTYPTLVVLAYKALHSGPSGYGFLSAAVGAGAVLGALVVPRLMREYSAGMLILVGVAGIGISYFLTGLLQDFALAMLFLFGVGLANNLYLVPILSVTQREAPDYVRGRVMAGRFLLAQLGLLSGMILAGPLTDRLGAPLVFAAAGFLAAAAGLVGFGFKNLRNATLRDEAPAPALEAVSG